MSSMSVSLGESQKHGGAAAKLGVNLVDGATGNHGVISTGSKPSKEKRTLRDLISKRLSQQGASGSTVKLIDLNISSIPVPDVELLRNVERLSLRKNLLLHLPSNFCHLKSLRYLDLDSNILQEIPPVLMQCPKLEILDLSYNNIECLPQDISALWSQQLKVLSLKNNNVGSIWGLRSIVKLENLRVLEIHGNPIKHEELEAVRAYTPMNPNIVKEEYRVIALRRYLEDHSSPDGSSDFKMSKAAKRMGYVNSPSPGSGDSAGSVTPSPVPPQLTNSEADSTCSTSETTNNDLYNHSKFNDYFKRLSILPEESSNNEQHKVSHDELVVACRKLLFSFTECQQNVRKIASFCKEKAVAVNVVSLLYSVRSHIDNLVGVLEQAESEKNSHDGALIKLCMTIITIFKQIISQLRKNFTTFFGADDLCFIRMFYMTLVCSYTEIYNAWCFIDAGEARKARSRHLARAHSAINLPTLGTSTNASALYLPRTRSNTLQSRAPPVGVSMNVASMESSLHNSVNHNGSALLSPPPHINSPSQVKAGQNAASTTPPSNNALVHSVSHHSNDSKHSDSSPRQYHTHSPRPRKVTDSQALVERDGAEADAGPLSTSSGASSVDAQLYQTLGTVISMVNVVYERLTAEISKAAIASTTGQQEFTDVLLSKIRDLTDTCCQAMELSKILNERLHLLTSADISEQYLSTSEKVKTWENINAFLKSIISILANTKVVMTDMPGLNEIRPNLASLAKITKDVTVILELSSYKGVSVLTAQNQAQNTSQTQSHGHFHHVSNQQLNIGLEDREEKFHISITTPQLTPSHSQLTNPFENLGS